jgi:predicted membrane protein
MSKMGLFHSRLSEKEGARMVLLIIFGVTIGAILGTRFRVLSWCQQSFSLPRSSLRLVT